MYQNWSDTEKTAHITKTVKNSMDPREWAVFEELRIGGGTKKEDSQRLDLWAINYYPSKGNKTRCVEVKASRSDFFNEIKKPIKRRAGLRLSHEFYFATPPGLVQIEEVPVECGLMEVLEDGTVNVVIKAPVRSIMPPNYNFVSSILRRLDKERLYHFLMELQDDEWQLHSGNLALDLLSEHISMWTHHTAGNKEIPDKIADAFRGFRSALLSEMIKKGLVK